MGPSPLPPTHRLTLVGEAPGRVEEKFGGPFLGLSGKLVDKLLVGNHLKRSETYLTNAALCRSEVDKENEIAAVCCAPRLLNELAATPAGVPIAALGKTASATLLETRSILLARGFIWEVPPGDPVKLETARKAVLKQPPDTPNRGRAELKYQTLLGRARLSGRTVFPMLHPAFILRSETWHPILKQDFRRVARWIATGAGGLALQDLGEHQTTQDVGALYRLGPEVSLDVETTMSGSALTAKLLCVGLSDGMLTVVLWPWRPGMAAGLGAFLHSRKAVIGHNLMQFDKIVLERHGIS